MAAKRKTNLPAKAENKALAQGGSWEERMKAMAEQAAEREPLTGGCQWLSVRNGDFHYGDDVLGDAINVVVLDFSFDNAYYGGQATAEARKRLRIRRAIELRREAKEAGIDHKDLL